MGCRNFSAVTHFPAVVFFFSRALVPRSTSAEHALITHFVPKLSGVMSSCHLLIEQFRYIFFLKKLTLLFIYFVTAASTLPRYRNRPNEIFSAAWFY